MILVSPAEPRVLKDGRKVSPLPERMGLDFAWLVKGAWHGVQRKTIADLKASVDDGRLGKELGQMKSAGVQGVVLIEGRESWTVDGVLRDAKSGGYGREWTRQQWWGVQLGVQMEGVWVCQVASIADTLAFLESFYIWTQKRRHGSLQARPNVKGLWGTSAKDVDYACHVLTSIPGVGQAQARAIYDHFGGLPFKLSCDVDELMRCKGVGKKRATTIAQLFGETNGC